MNTDRETRPQVVLVNRCFVLGDDNKILLIKRIGGESYAPEQWECPGGKLDQGQDLAHAREREVLEETGLLVTMTHQLLYADSYVIGTGKYTGLPFVSLFGIGKVLGGKLKLSPEHTEHAWVSYDEALSYELTSETRKAVIVLKEYLTDGK